MESPASCMEIEVIAAKNAALLAASSLLSRARVAPASAPAQDT